MLYFCGKKCCISICKSISVSGLRNVRKSKRKNRAITMLNWTVRTEKCIRCENVVNPFSDNANYKILMERDVFPKRLGSGVWPVEEFTPKRNGNEGTNMKRKCDLAFILQTGSLSTDGKWRIPSIFVTATKSSDWKKTAFSK